MNALHTHMLPAAKVAQTPYADVLNWLAPGEEQQALDVVQRRFARAGGLWVTHSMPSVSAARAAAINRAVGGDPPVVFQVSAGEMLPQLARHGIITPAPVDPRALDRALPKLVSEGLKVGGKYMAVPFSMRGENYLFYNKSVLQLLGIGAPRSIGDILHIVTRARLSGIRPVAVGSEPWQLRVLFNGLFLGIGGPETYTAAYVGRKQSALGSPAVLKAFQAFAAIRDANGAASGATSWRDATRMMAKGEAAMQVMGEWAKAETSRHLDVSKPDVGCMVIPSAKPAYMVAVDAFAFSAVEDARKQYGQRIFATSLMDRTVRIDISRSLATVPIGLRPIYGQQDECLKSAYAVLASGGSLVPSTGLFALTGSMSGAVDDYLATFWYSRQTPEEGATRLAALLASAEHRANGMKP